MSDRRDSRTGWYLDVDEMGRSCAVTPEGDLMHIFDAQRWLTDIAADLGLEANFSPSSEQKRINRNSGDKPRPGRWEGEPPSGKQLAFLEELGYEGAKPPTKGFAAELIEELLAGA